MELFPGVLLLSLLLIVQSAAAGSSQVIKLITDAGNGAPTVAPPNIWPMPVKIDSGNVTLAISLHLEFESAHESEVLAEAFARYTGLIFTHTVGMRQKAAGVRKDLQVLERVNVCIEEKDETLQFGTDESYTLSIPADGGTAQIKAATVFGALHGLETFSQLCRYSFSKHTVELAGAPWCITDRPRFQHRGLLVDTSRHWQPLVVIKDIIRSLAYAKLNVLHWHMVDTQSFPIEVPSFPKLWLGSYTPAERYTVDDLKDIVEFARLHGVMVMAEFDVPGHARSWGVGYPELWPSPSCHEPLDVSKNFTFELIDKLLEDMAAIFPYKLVHLGGDEVDTSCWSSTEHVKDWLAAKNISAHDAYSDFVLRAQKLAVKHGWEPVNWYALNLVPLELIISCLRKSRYALCHRREEPFDEFGDRLHNRTIVHVWFNKPTTSKAVAAGRRVLVSNQDKWYLDHLNTQWAEFYNNEPTEGIEDPKQKELVIGGEVCMWGETVDASNMQQTVWPRAAAAAERLWSPQEHVDAGLESALPRLEHFRCLLNRRGVRAAPTNNLIGRMAPLGPGSCYSQ